MRMHFQEKPWDLVGTVGYTLLMTAVLLALSEGDVLAVLLLFFIPGYVVVASLFPKETELDWIERIALSIGLSIAVVPLLGLLLNFTPWGISFLSVVGTIALFTASVGCTAYLRRMRLPANQRLSLTIDLAVPKWREYNPLDKGLTIALAGSILVAVVTLAYIVTAPRPENRFTEFYVLGPGGNASGYPTRLNVSEPGSVILGVVNHESAAINYTVRVDLIGLNVVFNASCSCNQTEEMNRTSLAWMNQTLVAAGQWIQQYTFRINATGLWKLEFLLYKDAVLTGQKPHIFIRVP